MRLQSRIGNHHKWILLYVPLIRISDRNKRNIFRDINSGGSFGSSPLRSEIGLGEAERIESIEVRWAGSNKVQTFHDISVNQFIEIKEGDEQPISLGLKRITWVLPDRICY